MRGQADHKASSFKARRDWHQTKHPSLEDYVYRTECLAQVTRRYCTAIPERDVHLCCNGLGQSNGSAAHVSGQKAAADLSVDARNDVEN